MRARLPIAAVVLLTALSASAEAREISVKPGQNLRGIVGAARAGDTVNVAAGTYVAALSIPSGVRLVSKDGPGKARIDGGGRGETIPIYHRRDIVIDGFEIFHSGENIVKIEGSRNITLRHCKIHDAGEDCVKATIGSQFITVEECEIYNPGRHADDGRYEQNVDFMDTERAVVRRCLLYHVGGHGDQIGFFKAESKAEKYKPGGRGCVFEQNVVLNAGGGPNDSPAFTLGQESDSEWRHGQHACYDAIIRDNVFVNCRNGAIGFYGCYGGYAYGNVIINSGPPFGFHRAGVGVRPAIDLVFIVNNAVLNPGGNLERMFEGRQNLDGRMLHDYNLVWNGGKTPPTDAHEPHGDGRRPPLPAVMTASPAEGYAVLAARFAALAPHRADGEALLPAAAHAGDPDRGLPVSSAVGEAAEDALEYLALQGADETSDGERSAVQPQSMRRLSGGGFVAASVGCPGRRKFSGRNRAARDGGSDHAHGLYRIIQQRSDEARPFFRRERRQFPTELPGTPGSGNERTACHRAAPEKR